jgi:hypothetical protein
MNRKVNPSKVKSTFPSRSILWFVDYTLFKNTEIWARIFGNWVCFKISQWKIKKNRKVYYYYYYYYYYYDLNGKTICWGHLQWMANNAMPRSIKCFKLDGKRTMGRSKTSWRKWWCSWRFEEVGGPKVAAGSQGSGVVEGSCTGSRGL